MSATDARAPTEGDVLPAADQPKDAAGPSPTRTYANGKPYDALLCTICGLTSCWQSPKNAQPAEQKA
jgi:hypothetical protein